MNLRCLTLALLISWTLIPMQAYSEPVLLDMKCTAYCCGEITYDGHKVRKGIASAKKEMIGLTAIVYSEDLSEIYGIYEICDTGSSKGIKKGKVLDIYLPTEKECKEWGCKDVKVQFIDAKG